MFSFSIITDIYFEKFQTVIKLMCSGTLDTNSEEYAKVRDNGFTAHG